MIQTKPKGKFGRGGGGAGGPYPQGSKSVVTLEIMKYFLDK